ncbi:unnamed protein product [Periconia digitata]|uniref:Uncharacterized protein n=1 Tax=Periconia digitata TaxID=1303443 RepID=A0A9W4XSW7_9PLEO|nr:unnamed protein product [Periconia digitata]
MEEYKISRIGAEDIVKNHLELIDQALEKNHASTNFEKLVVRVHYALPDSVTRNGFPKDTQVEIIAKILSKLKSERLSQCRDDEEYLEKGSKFLQSSEGESWINGWFSPKDANIVEASKRKGSKSITKRSNRPKGIAIDTFSEETGASSSSKGVRRVPPAPSSSSINNMREIVSVTMSSPHGSAASPKELPSSAVLPELSPVICSTPTPFQVGENVLYSTRGGGLALCLQCWTIHDKTIGGPFVDLWPSSHSGPLSTVLFGNHIEEINRLNQRLSARRVVGMFAIGGACVFSTLVWLLSVLFGSQARQQ